MSKAENVPYVESNLYRLRHTAAHILAAAVLQLYPQAKLGIGPPIADGFYYDFDLGVDEEGQAITFKADDLPRLEAGMRRVIGAQYPLVYREIGQTEAATLFADQPYKLELIADLLADDEEREETAVLSTYRLGNFEDLCRGPHVADTGNIPADSFKLMSIAGAYWRGDEQRPMLQRIYGTAWPNKKALKRHLALLEEAKKRDHRKLGRELEIYIMDEEVGPGLPLWLPNGNILREELAKLAYEMEAKGGYQRVSTPHIAKEALYLRSGHLPYYEDEMYAPMDKGGSRYFLKPMNCPFHHKIFGSKPRSYRDMPVRLAEYGMVYRYEASGQLFGLMRVRAAEQNDAHIYCSEAQLEVEFTAVLDLYRYYFDLFGIERFEMQLSKHSKAGLGKKYVDNEVMWIKIESQIREFMLNSGIPFVEAEGEAAFYGPKIDVQVWSAIGREFSLATNQVDFAAAAKFDLAFVNEQGQAEMPLCIHRAPLGSHERFIGFLIEHYAGKFPVWLAPEQVRIIPITDAHNRYAKQVEEQLAAAHIRVQADLGADRINGKIRQAQKMQIPYMLVVGDKEMAAGMVSLRRRDGRRQNNLSIQEFSAHVVNQIVTRSLEL